MTATLTAGEVSSPSDSPPSIAFEYQPPLVVTIRVDPRRKSPRWLPYVAHRLNELASRADEPDLEGIRAPDASVLERSLRVLRELLFDDTPTPSVVPTSDGGVQFVWHKAGWDIEIEVLPSETYVWGRNRRETGREFSGTLPDRSSELRETLREISVSSTGGHA